MSALLCSLEPDLNFVAIRIGDVSVWEAGSELATTEQASSGAFDLVDGRVDVVGVHEPKAEMRHASPETGRGGVLGEGEDVVPTRRLSVDEPVSAPVLTQTEDLLVEPQSAFQVAHREIDMRKAVGLNHAYLQILSRSNGNWAGLFRLPPPTARSPGPYCAPHPSQSSRWICGTVR